MTPKANLSLDVLLLPALYTPSQSGWLKTNHWRTCHFFLPPSESYAVSNRIPLQLPIFSNLDESCRIQLQFEVFRGQELDGAANLTEPFCLRGTVARVVKGEPEPVAIKLALPSFTTVEQLKAAARDYQMQFLGGVSQGKVLHLYRSILGVGNLYHL